MNKKQLDKYMSEPHEKTRFASVEIRSQWNPLRYVFGEFYFKKL